MIPSVHDAFFNEYLSILILPFYGVVFFQQTAYGNRLGDSSKLHTSHPIHTGRQRWSQRGINQDTLKPSYHWATLPKPPLSVL